MDQESKEEAKSAYGGNGKLLSKTIKLLGSTNVLQGKLAILRRSWWILMMAITITGVRT